MQHTFFLIRKKTILPDFLYISLPLFCTTTTSNFQKLPSSTFYGGNVVCVPVHFFFYRCRSFSPSWQLAFPLFLTATKKFLCFSFNEIGLLWFLSLALALPLLSTSFRH